MREYLELFGDVCIVLFGALLIYIFTVIELSGQYGQEPNVIIRRIELFMGIPLVVLGMWHLIQDIKEIKKW